MREPLPPRIRAACLIAALACALPLLIQMPAWLMAILLALAALGALTKKPWPWPLRMLLTLSVGGLVWAAYDFSIGRDTGSAGLLAMLMLKPLETHNARDARSLLGFSLFAPFTAFLQDQGPLTLILCLLATLLSLSTWALLVQGPRARSTPYLLRRAALSLLMAAPMALAGFWLFPRLATPLWGLPEKAVGRMGLGDRMTPNEWLDVLVDDSPALRAHFQGTTPPREQMYWRGPVLIDFDGEAWTRNLATADEPVPRLAPISPEVRYEVMLEPTERRDLLLLDLPTAAPDIAQLNGELTAVTVDAINNLIVYNGQSAPKARFLDALSPAQKTRMLSLPPGRDPRIRALARQWRAETADPLALTERFLQWVRKDFQYTISAPPVGFNATDEFMFETQQGFCQHFSSAYAVFMRTAGVPTRVVTGYVGGHYNRVGDYWLVYRKDAHAWTEIWLDGRGWVRVDPTAAVAPDNILDTVETRQAQQGLVGQVLEPMFDTSDFLRRSWNNLMLGYDAARQKSLLRPLGIPEAQPWHLVLAFSIGASLAVGLSFWLLLRQNRDRSDPLLRAWRGFVRRLAKAGWVKGSNEPPLSFARRVATELDELAPAVWALSQRYCDWRYAASALSDEQKRALIEDLRRFRLPTRPRHGVRP